MKRVWMVLALGLAPGIAWACGDYDKSASASDQLGLAQPPAATKVPAPTVAKATIPKSQKSNLVKVSSTAPERTAPVARN